jgi:hypothetical protein
MKIESDVEKFVDGDGEESWMITITAKEGDDILFTFRPEHPGRADEWGEMMTACQIEDMNNSLSSEGDCQISVNNKHAFFELSRHGDGYGGEVEIMIPKKLCVDAFRNIYTLMMRG